MNTTEKSTIKTIMMKVEKDAGSTFCLAKWHHVTLYLQSGETHSCYHPRPHHIPLEEIAVNPSALHNTEHKKLERNQMLNGEKPTGCQYCWNIESMGKDYISDRHIKTASIYSEERLTEILTSPWDMNINPSYVEINFGNECNFKCGYCHPKYSTRFYNEIKEHGPVTTVKNHRCDVDWMKLYQREEENPYVEAWWKWWPTLKQSLKILRITGGEPTMHRSTWQILDDLNNDPLPSLELNINSNLGIKTELVTRMSDKVTGLLDNKKIKSFKLFTSIDTWGNRAEYIRTGLDLNLWETNFETYMTRTESPISLMITFNVLSVTTFKTLLEKILELRAKYNNGTNRIRFDTPYLKEPLQYDINILPKEEFMPFMHESLKYISDNVDDGDINKFSSLEYERFRRVVDYMETTMYAESKINQGQKDFYNWFNALDSRRETKFLSVFPEMTEFYKKCEELNNGI